ncbi:hypothetical protein HYW76_05650 [Candidatus Pacearchaeota archaeon]|nr:hypothetical protein [Candidatus Pacearchaeota archaeon]
MEIKEAQKQAYKVIVDYNKKNNRKNNKESVFPHLVEEVGELAREIGHEKDNYRGEFNKEKFQKELIDVIFQAMILATEYNIDVDSVLTAKIQEFRKRFDLN